MNITQLAKRPELFEIVVDDEDIVKTYGEAITFHMYDHVDINTYFDFYRVQQEQDGRQLNALLKKIIVDKDGKPCIGDDDMLPIDVTLAVLVKVNESLGKSKTKQLTPETGNQSD
jgi:hypothetical protein